MLSGPPLPLPSRFQVAQLLPFLHRREQVGVWLQDVNRKLHLHLGSPGRTFVVLVARDLGYLLRRCSWVVLRVEQQPLVLHAEELIRCRALQVVAGTPYLPGPEYLRRIFPEVELHRVGFSIPIRDHSPEEVLGLCLSYGIPVVASTINYAPG